LRRELGRDHRFLEQSPDDQQQPHRHHSAIELGGLLELGHEIGGPDDRPGDEVREERHQQQNVEQSRGGHTPAVHVDNVADPLEGEERDADRQDHLHQRRVLADAEQGEQAARLFGEEVEIFEEAEHQEIGRDAADQQRPARARIVAARDQRGGAPVDQRRADQ